MQPTSGDLCVRGLAYACVACVLAACSSADGVTSARDAAVVDASHDAGRDGGTDAGSSGGWHLTTYFSALDSFYGGATAALTGCLNVDCSAGTDPTSALGTYSVDFTVAVQTEGTGKITTGPQAGQYLNWSASQPGSGYWLDTAPRDAQGNALVPYVSAASHPSYAFGANFAVLDCGVDMTAGTPMDPAACADFMAATWQIRDRFEANTEVRHLDLYIGLQTALDMNDDPHFVDQITAVTTLP